MLVKLPFKDNVVAKIVKTIPKTHTIEDFKNLDNFPICILSDMFETIDIDIDINNSGIKNEFINIPIKFTIINKIGSITVDVVIVPVVSIKVVNNGINNPIKFVIFPILSFVKSNTDTKLFITNVTIIKYCTK